MTKFHVIAAAGDLAEDLRSLGVYDAESATVALETCLAELDRDPVEDRGGEMLADDLAALPRLEQSQLREALMEPGVSFIVVPTRCEAHLVRYIDGQFVDAAEVERKKAQIRRDFGIDVL